MNQRLAAALLAGLSIVLIIAELFVAAFVGFDSGLMLFILSLCVGLAGLLFAVPILSDSRREVVESVSERRARARRDGGMSGMFDAYDIDQEFVGRGLRERKPGSSAAGAEYSGKGEPARGDKVPDVAPARSVEPERSLSIDKESFDDYIRRCMSEPGTCIDQEPGDTFSVGLDADGLSSMPSTPPTDFSHNPRAVISRLGKPGGTR